VHDALAAQSLDAEPLEGPVQWPVGVPQSVNCRPVMIPPVAHGVGRRRSASTAVGTPTPRSHNDMAW